MAKQIPLSKLHRYQVGLMLDILGIPLKEQDGSIKRRKDQLEVFKNTDPEGYNFAYHIVVEYGTAETAGASGQTAVANTIAYPDAVKMITEVANVLEAGAVERIEGKCSRQIEERERQMAEFQKQFVAAVDLKFKAAVERESKKYNTIAIKVGERKAKPIKGVVTEKFPRILQLAEARKNILLVGPSGCGKTHVASQLADALDMKYGSQSCSAGVSESVFAGWLLPTGENGRFDHVMSVFLDIYENGGVFLFDEFDNSDANVAVFLNQALAQDHFFLPQRYKKPFIKKSKDFVAIAAANTFGTGADGMYHGRIALDAATLDRFRTGTIYMGYSAAIEEAHVRADVLEWGRMIRNKIDAHRMKKIMSTRVLIEASDMIDRFDWTIPDVEVGYFADWSREEKAVCGFQSRGGEM